MERQGIILEPGPYGILDRYVAAAIDDAVAAERALADALVSASNYYIGRLEAVWRGKVVRDLGEAQVAYASAVSAILRARAQKAGGE
jgi:hypothetical protein